MAKTNENKKTVAELVTARIIDKLEAGVIPWHKPWQGGEAVNYITRKPYSGINRLLLDGGEYLTFKQVQECGGRVNKGAKAHMVAFYKDYIKEDEDEDGNKLEKVIPVLRYYNVFALSDCSGIDSKIVMEQRKNYTIEECEEITGGYISASGIDFHNDQPSARAYYKPSCDRIVVPMLNQFDSSQEYYSTLFHEMIHSTGHHSRLNRFNEKETYGAGAAFGSKAYAREELVAEIGCAMLCSHTGIDADAVTNNSAAYIGSWLKVLRNDANAVLYAAAKAEKAVEYILDRLTKTVTDIVTGITPEVNTAVKQTAGEKARQKAQKRYFNKSAFMDSSRADIKKAWMDNDRWYFCNSVSIVCTSENLNNAVEAWDNKTDGKWIFSDPALKAFAKEGESLGAFNIRETISHAKSTGYKLTRKTLSSYLSKDMYLLSVKDTFIRVSLLDLAWSVIDNGKPAELFYMGKHNGIKIKTDIGEAIVLPLRLEKSDTRDLPILNSSQFKA